MKIIPGVDFEVDYKEYLKKLNELTKFFIPADKKQKEKMVMYLRIYTDLIMASCYLGKPTYKRMITLLKLVKRFTKNTEFKEEQKYMQRIHEIVTSILSNIRCTYCKATDCHLCNPAHSRSKMQLAQNICILRILKISRD